jgi:IS1 family transposase
LELDELWSFVGKKDNQKWIWLALERQTRRIVGFAIGDRSAETCQKLWASLPADYRPVGKETGQTAHIERFNNTLRQRCANLVRRTLSFSKNDHWHEVRIRLFIDHYNRQLQPSLSRSSV